MFDLVVNTPLLLIAIIVYYNKNYHEMTCDALTFILDTANFRVSGPKRTHSFSTTTTQ